MLKILPCAWRRCRHPLLRSVECVGLRPAVHLDDHRRGTAERPWAQRFHRPDIRDTNRHLHFQLHGAGDGVPDGITWPPAASAVRLLSGPNLHTQSHGDLLPRATARDRVAVRPQPTKIRRYSSSRRWCSSSRLSPVEQRLKTSTCCPHLNHCKRTSRPFLNRTASRYWYASALNCTNVTSSVACTSNCCRRSFGISRIAQRSSASDEVLATHRVRKAQEHRRTRRPEHFRPDVSGIPDSIASQNPTRISAQWFCSYRPFPSA
jgi:hypothetical protein